MKTLTFLILLVPILGMNALAQNPEVQKLMDDKAAREEIYNTIMNNHNLMMEFLGDVQNNEHAKAMLQQHHAMYETVEGDPQGMMMGNNQHMKGNNQNMMGMNQENTEKMNQMMGYIQDNPQVMPGMMGSMMDMCATDSTLCNPMAEVMSQHPQMMRLGIQKMNENSQNIQPTKK